MREFYRDWNYRDWKCAGFEIHTNLTFGETDVLIVTVKAQLEKNFVRWFVDLIKC